MAEQRQVRYSQGRVRLRFTVSYLSPGAGMAHSARHRGGFATLAYPAEFGNSGIMSFIVSHHGKVYERDLGEETGSRRVRPRGARPCRLDSIRRLGAKGGIQIPW
jgi:hypothetical protein